MTDLKQSTAIVWPFFVHDVNGDAVPSLTDGSFTKRISKAGGAFGAMAVTVTELENGWYSLPLTAAHTDTLEMLTVTLTNVGAKQVNLQWRVTVHDPGDIPTAVLEKPDGIESGYSLQESQRLQNSGAAGILSGAEPIATKIRIRDLNNTKDRIISDKDEDGNRVAVLTDVT